MTKYPVFPKAPITEALLDIRAQLPQEIDLKDIESFYDFVKEQFPEKKARMFGKLKFKLSPPDKPELLPSTGGIDGYLFQSSENKKAVQSRLDGFTFNKFRPYDRWESFRLEARQLWNLYFRTVNPNKVTRIALRYINRIEVPLPIKDFKEYILSRPEIAPRLPQGLNNFFMRFIITSPKFKAKALITQTMEEPTPNKKLPLILDIDVIHDDDYSGNDPKIWDDFEKLHIFKNQIFFNSITKKTKELFK